jgi:hypothetical protein
MRQLFQSLCERLFYSRADTSQRGENHTIRTEVEVTVEREVTTFQLGGVTSRSLDTCPMCGHRLAPGNKLPVNTDERR